MQGKRYHLLLYLKLSSLHRKIARLYRMIEPCNSPSPCFTFDSWVSQGRLYHLNLDELIPWLIITILQHKCWNWKQLQSHRQERQNQESRQNNRKRGGMTEWCPLPQFTPISWASASRIPEQHTVALMGLIALLNFSAGKKEGNMKVHVNYESVLKQHQILRTEAVFFNLSSFRMCRLQHPEFVGNHNYL